MYCIFKFYDFVIVFSLSHTLKIRSYLQTAPLQALLLKMLAKALCCGLCCWARLPRVLQIEVIGSGLLPGKIQEGSWSLLTEAPQEVSCYFHIPHIGTLYHLSLSLQRGG